jgi:hypothetical protein
LTITAKTNSLALIIATKMGPVSMDNVYALEKLFLSLHASMYQFMKLRSVQQEGF